MADDNIQFQWEGDDECEPGDVEDPITFDVGNCTDMKAMELALLKQKGEKSANRDHQMKLAKSTMKRAGWLDECQDGSLDFGDTSPMRPDLNQNAGQWRAAVQNMQELIAEFQENLPTNSNSDCILGGVNNVKIVDNSYLLNRFNPTLHSDYELIDHTIKKFSLNQDQS